MQDNTDPFKEFGGETVSESPSNDPFAEFGGSVVESPEKKSPIGSSSQDGSQGLQGGPASPSRGVEVPPQPIAGLGGIEVPKKEGQWQPTKLSPEDEQRYREFMTFDPAVNAWAEEFFNNYGEVPDIESSNYDYRGAWKAGIRPEPVDVDGRTEYHWGSIGEMGKELKSPDHPTRWKSDYMQVTGKNPDEEGVDENTARFMIGVLSGMSRVMDKVEAEKREVESGQFIVNGQAVSRNTAKKYGTDRAFMEGVAKGINTIEFGEGADPHIRTFLQRQAESAGEYDVFKSLKAGLLSAEGSMRALPVWMNDVLEEATGIPNPLFTTLMSFSPSTRRMAVSGVAKDKLIDLSEQVLKAAEKERESMFKTDYGDEQSDLIDLYRQGRYGEMGRMALNTTVESGPIMLSSAVASIMTGNPVAGAAFLVPMSASRQYAETGMDDRKYREAAAKKGITDKQAVENFVRSTRIANANVAGVAEGVPEALMGPIIGRSFTLFKSGARQIVQQVGGELGEQAAKDLADEMAKQTAGQITKNYAAGSAIGGVEELSTTLTNELSDVYLGISDKTFPQIMRSSLNDGLIGVASAGLMTGPGSATALGAKGVNASKKLLDNYLIIDPSALSDLNAAVDAMRVPDSDKEAIKQNIAKREKAVKAVPKEKVADTETVDKVEKKQELQAEMSGLDPVYQEPIKEEIAAIDNELREGIKKEYPAPTVNTTPTEDRYASVNRNDGKETVDLTREEYLAEMERRGTPVEEGAETTEEGFRLKTERDAIVKKMEDDIAKSNESYEMSPPLPLPESIARTPNNEKRWIEQQRNEIEKNRALAENAIREKYAKQLQDIDKKISESNKETQAEPAIQPATENVSESELNKGTTVNPALKDVESTTKALESNKNLVNKIGGKEYYHGTSLPKSEPDFTAPDKYKGTGVRSNSFTGTFREQKSPFFFITSEINVADVYAKSKRDYYNEELKPKEKHTPRVIRFKFDEKNSKVLDLTKDDYEFVLQDVGQSPIDFFGMGMYEQDQMWEMLDNPNFAEKLKSLGYDAVKFIEPERGVGIAVLNFDKIINSSPKSISEAYHKAKADGSNPELVQAVEELLTPTQDALQEPSAETRPVRQEPETRQGVREEDAQKQEAAREGQAEEEIDTVVSGKTGKPIKRQKRPQDDALIALRDKLFRATKDKKYLSLVYADMETVNVDEELLRLKKEIKTASLLDKGLIQISIDTLNKAKKMGKKEYQLPLDAPAGMKSTNISGKDYYYDRIAKNEPVQAQEQEAAREGQAEAVQEDQTLSEENFFDDLPDPDFIAARAAQKKEAKSPRNQARARAAAYNRMGKRERKGLLGNQIMAEIQQTAKENGFQVRIKKGGGIVILDENGKEIRRKFTRRTKQEAEAGKQQNAEEKAYRRDVLRATPVSPEHLAAILVASGARFYKKGLVDAGDANIGYPRWMVSTDPKKGLSIEMLYESADSMGFNTDAIQWQDEHMEKFISALNSFSIEQTGKQDAFEEAERIHQTQINGGEVHGEGMTDEDIRERAAYLGYTATLQDIAEAGELNRLTDEEIAELLSDADRINQYENSQQFIQDAERYAEKSLQESVEPEQGEIDANLLRAQEEGTSPKELAQRIRNKKFKGGAAMLMPDMGISVALYNGALELAAKQIEKGTTLGKAIANAIKYIDDRMEGKKWNKGLFGKTLNDRFKMTVQGREVEVQRDVTPETIEVVRGWYSPLEARIEESKNYRLPANKWIDLLKSKEGEDVWTGVRAFLEGKGTETVSKKELRDFMRDNRVEVLEVVKSTGDDFQQKLSALEKKHDVTIVTDEDPMTGGMELQLSGDRVRDLSDYEYQELQEEIYTELSTGIGSPVRHAAHQLPGESSNYKEILVTLPQTKRDWRKEYETAKERIELLVPLIFDARAIEKYLEKKEYYGLSGLSSQEVNTKRAAEAAIKKIEYAGDGDAVVEFEKAIKNKDNRAEPDKFRSSHFDEPNILVHLRMNTRTDSKGNSVLFLEEIQSDWGQIGKRKGFVGDKARELFNQFKYELMDVAGKKLHTYSSADGEMIISSSEKLESAKETAEGVAKRNAELLYTGEVPSAPFVTSTPSWVKLGLKAALKEAVAQGVDKVAWTTGTQQNERYRLDKVADEVRYRKNADGTYRVIAYMKGENVSENSSLDEGKLEETLGKDIAQRVKDNVGEEVEGEMSLTGENLKIEGTGMKSFYDDIVPKVAKSLVKDLTGKDGVITEASINGSPQQSIEITPEIASAVKSGLPLFSESVSRKEAIDKRIADAKADLTSFLNQQGVAFDPENNAAQAKQLEKKLIELAKAFIERGMLTAEEFVESALETFSKYGDKVSDYIKKHGPRIFEAAKPAQKQTAKKPTTGKDVREARAEEREKAKAAREKAAEKARAAKEKAAATAKESKAKAVERAVEKAKQKYVNIGARIGEAFGKMEGEIVGTAKGIKQAAQMQKWFSAQVNTILQDMVSEAKESNPDFSVTPKQLNAITKRLLAVNPFSNNSFKNAVEYMEKVLADATYVDRMDKVRDAQKAVKRRKHPAFQSAVNQFLSIKPEMLPDALVDAYMDALGDMSKSVPSYRKMQDIFFDVMQNIPNKNKPYDEAAELTKAEALFDKILEQEAAATTIKDYMKLLKDIQKWRAMAERIKALDPNPNISDAYDDLIDQMDAIQERFEKKHKDELSDMKAIRIGYILNRMKSLDPYENPSGYNNLNLTDEAKVMLKRLSDISESALNELSFEEITTLGDILDLVQQDGYVDMSRLTPIVSKAVAKANAEPITKQVENAKDVGNIKEMQADLSRSDASFREGIMGLGRVRLGAFYTRLIAPILRASAEHYGFVNSGRRFFNNRKKEYRINEKGMDRIGMFMFYLREHALSFNPKFQGKTDSNGKEYGTRDWFAQILEENKPEYGVSGMDELKRKSGIPFIGSTNKYFRMKDAFDSFPKDSEGNVDVKAVYESFKENKTDFLSRNELNFLKEVLKWDNDNTLGKQRAANEMRGKPFDEIMFHIFRKRTPKLKSVEVEPAQAVLTDKNRVKLASDSGKAVVSEKVEPIEFNFEELFDTNLNEVSRDYYYTPALMQFNATIKEVKRNLSANKQKLMDIAAWDVQESLNHELSFGETNKVVRNILKANAMSVFIDVVRTGIELASSLTSYPLRARISPMRAAKNIFADSEVVKQILSDTSSPLMNKENIQKHFELEKGTIKEKGAVEKLTYAMAGAPERVLIKPIWFGRFQVEFFNRTGEQFDPKKYSEPSYKKKYRQEILDSAAAADGEYQKIAGSVTGVGGRRKARVLPEILGKALGMKSKGDISTKTNMGMLLTYMTGYQSRDLQQATEAMRSMSESFKEKGLNKDMAWAAAIPVGSVLGLFTYSYLSQLKYAAQRMLMAKDDEEEEEAKKELETLSTASGAINEIATGIASLAATRYNGMGRQLLKAIGSVLYNMADNKEDKRKIRMQVRNLTLSQNPYDIDRYGSDKANMYETAGEGLAAASVVVNNFSKATKNYKDVQYIFKKIENGEPLTTPEKDILLMTKFMISAFNATAQFAGGSIPSSSFNRFVDRVAKEAGPSTAVEVIKESKKKAEAAKIADTEALQGVISEKNKGGFVNEKSVLGEIGTESAKEYIRKHGGTVPSLLDKLTKAHNIETLSEKDSELARVVVTADGDGKNFVEADMAAARYSDNVSKTGISEEHLELMQSAISAEYRKKFEEYYLSAQKQTPKSK